MARKYSMTEIHESARSYHKVKAKHVIKELYQDFVSWEHLPAFSCRMKTPGGKVIELNPDPNIIIGEATFLDQRVCVIAQQTGTSDEEYRALNWDLVTADGYGLACNMMAYAQTHHLTLHTWVDTVGGDPFEKSAAKLQSWMIAYCQERMIYLRTKSISTILGRGGSGGAIALQLAHQRLILQLAEYSVIAAEGCAAIKFHDVNPKSVDRALEMLRLTPDHMLKYGIVDQIIPEPSLDEDGYLAITLENIRHALIAATARIDTFDLRFLQRDLMRKIIACGSPGKITLSRHVAQKTRRFFRRIASGKEEVSIEVAHIRQAVSKNPAFNPNACNDEHDPKSDPNGDIVRPGCHAIFDKEDFHNNYNSCPSCARPQTLTPEEYATLLLDNDPANDQHSFHELYADLTCEHIDGKFDFFDYASSRKRAMQSTDSKEALVIGYGLLFDIPVAIAISDFAFMGGSLGSVVGEKMRLICEFCIKKRIPLISLTATGGARMEEGTIALYQMAKTVIAVTELKRNNLPFVSILEHPTTGGTLASYAVLGNPIFAVEKATVRFAGHRVVKLTSGGRMMELETTFSDFFERHGGVYAAVKRRQIKQMVYGALCITPWHAWYASLTEQQQIARCKQLDPLNDKDL